MGRASRRNRFLKILEEARQKYRFVVVGYVVMPEHFHMLISEPEQGTPSTVMQVVKQRFAHQVLKLLRKKGPASQPRLWEEQTMYGNGGFTISMCGPRRSARRSCAICIATR